MPGETGDGETDEWPPSTYQRCEGVRFCRERSERRWPASLFPHPPGVQTALCVIEGRSIHLARRVQALRCVVRDIACNKTGRR